MMRVNSLGATAGDRWRSLGSVPLLLLINSSSQYDFCVLLLPDVAYLASLLALACDACDRFVPGVSRAPLVVAGVAGALGDSERWAQLDGRVQLRK